jgi:membrane carboxypeptidase/penicillin-binding protein
MGEHTIREILRRRSPETQRAMQRRRELAQGGAGGSGMAPRIVLALLVLGFIAGVAYLVYAAHGASTRFGAEKAARTGGLTLAGNTEFLPNTLLAADDPDFYKAGGLGGTLLTRRLMRLYHPDAPNLVIRAMAFAVEAGYTKSDVVEAFINDVPMGGGAHPVKGFAAAATYYFGKPFAQLAPQDIALLVAIADDPEGLDPRQYPDKAMAARSVVLQDDVQQNVLGEGQMEALSKLPLDVVPPPPG